MPEPAAVVPSVERATIRFREMQTPHGPMFLAASEVGLCRTTIPGQSFADLSGWIERRLPWADLVPDDDALAPAADALVGFFDGEPLPDLAVDLIGTPFQCAVYRAVLGIPYGQTRSYAEIARAIGHPLANRAVGAANAANPLPFVVPCHRVVGADGSIKGFPGDVITRLMLLKLEGAR